MPGVTKKIYLAKLRDLQKNFTSYIKEIEILLPKNYDFQEIMNLLQIFRPHEIKEYNHLKNYYDIKSHYINQYKNYERYNMPMFDNFLNELHITQKLLEDEHRIKHSVRWNEDEIKNQYNLLLEKRQPKIDKVNKKIKENQKRTQLVTSEYIKKIIKMYDKCDQKDKMYIFVELKRYYNDDVINFLYKLVDTELNKQLRFEALYLLQSYNYSPRMRKQKYFIIRCRNKKKKNYLKNIYPNLTTKIDFNPNQLSYNIKNSKIQKIKHYDYFISHSYIDHQYVQKVISYENGLGKDIYCDWISDLDYLKRELVCSDTLKVIEDRIKKSSKVLFIESNNSKNSLWCKYELNFALNLGIPIEYITLNEIDNDSYLHYTYDENWFYEPVLLNKFKIK